MSIPASNIVQIIPGVVSAGGASLSLNGVILDTDQAIPSGSILQFNSASAVAAYFGQGSLQANLATIYFAGFDGSTQKPGLLYFAPFAASARAAEILGGSLAAITLATLQTYSGTLIVKLAGTTHTSANIDLSTATSFSNAASLIAAAFTAPGFTVSYNSTRAQFVITSSSTGATQTIESATGTIAANLKLTTATGAMLSPGADADTPATAMNNVTKATRNWAGFMTTFEPTTDDKVAFAAWNNAQGNLYAYIGWDTDALAIVANQPTTFGARVNALNYNGTFPIAGDASVAMLAGTTATAQARNIAAFVLGTMASIDFGATNGRTDFDFRSQSGLAFNVNDEQVGLNLESNGYNFYGSYATAAQPFIFLHPGKVSGAFKWMDSYVNQIKLNADFQLAGMTLLTTAKSIGYNPSGYTRINTAFLDPINAAVNFGSIRAGVELDELQAAQINSDAGTRISEILTTRGWYLQIKDPGAQVRAQRGSPICNFWYTDGGSVQKITLNSVNVQ